MIREIVLRPHKGWVRLWLLIALVWAAFASTLVEAPWQIDVGIQSSVDVAPAEIPATEARLRGQAETTCQPGTASVSHRPFGSSDYDWVAVGVVRSDTGAARPSGSPPPTHVVELKCIAYGAKTKAMAALLEIMFGPPIAIPLLLALGEAIVLGIVGWVREGFRQAAAPALAGGVASGAMPADDAPAPVHARDLKKALSWSCLGLMLLDIVLRSALSQGQSSGTNLLVFGGLAAIVWFARSRFGATGTPAATSRALGLTGLSARPFWR